MKESHNVTDLRFHEEVRLTPEHMLITEWEATLWGDVILKNTVSELEAS